MIEIEKKNKLVIIFFLLNLSLSLIEMILLLEVFEEEK